MFRRYFSEIRRCISDKKNICECLANIPRLVADHPRIFAEHFSPDKTSPMGRENFNASIENFAHREMLPHEFRLFAEGSIIPPEHRLMLVNFHR